MVDMHTHTTYSDGDKTLKELLIEAEKNNVTILSILHICPRFNSTNKGKIWRHVLLMHCFPFV